ncbi:Holliday junction branch migration DNA helicase RuvB [Microcystis aeruginosa CS-564/01]|uniref:Holliday junction branch migration DNA helicase RuvB n=1 Tax=Microcystis aeruginosa TaxID=1126 RepID=UPI00232D0444|nr:Holliday junction branch migration DNA helicase RuvB [Microcystis aeruginosa]MDB9426909.1 Holliday junction branch migration DNA helicase RuvB [Microcystis aeruginosa CS-564/01]
MAIKRSHNSPPAAEENLLTPNPTIEETEKAEAQIRPQSLEDYIGQQDLKANLKVTIAAAKARQEAIDHLLFYGPPGLGKTTMALILAAEMGVNCRITAAPALERPRDITGILINLQPRDILFIDEIHRLNRVTEELLYPAMEDYRLDVTIGKGQAAKIRSISLPPFTLIGATTKVGSLTAPLRDRFGMIQRLRFYTVEELTAIMLRSATIFNIPITEAGAIEISRRSRGTPRIANRLLKRVRDYVQVKGETIITPQLAAEGLNQLNVDSMGLDWTDRLVLKTMIEQFQGKPVGLEAVAAATGEDAKTIEEVYEPYLLQIGYLNRTPRGRVVTAAAYEHLGLLAKLPKNKDRSLPLFEF